MADKLPFDDYYKLFGIAVDFDSAKTLSKSYKVLSLKYHPDRNPDKDTTDTFQRIKQAYETLNNESERAVYERSYKAREQRKIRDANMDRKRARMKTDLEDRERAHKIRKTEDTQRQYANKYATSADRMPKTSKEIEQQIASSITKIQAEFRKKHFICAEDFVVLKWDSGINDYSYDDLIDQFKSFGAVANIKFITNNIALLLYRKEDGAIKLMYSVQEENKRFGNTNNRISVSWADNAAGKAHFQRNDSPDRVVRKSEIPPTKGKTNIAGPTFEEYQRFETLILGKLLQ